MRVANEAKNGIAAEWDCTIRCSHSTPADDPMRGCSEFNTKPTNIHLVVSIYFYREGDEGKGVVKHHKSGKDAKPSSNKA